MTLHNFAYIQLYLESSRALLKISKRTRLRTSCDSSPRSSSSRLSLSNFSGVILLRILYNKQYKRFVSGALLEPPVAGGVYGGHLPSNLVINAFFVLRVDMCISSYVTRRIPSTTWGGQGATVMAIGRRMRTRGGALSSRVPRSNNPLSSLVVRRVNLRK